MSKKKAKDCTFIDLTSVLKDGEQDHITLKIESINMTSSKNNEVFTEAGIVEVTEESMQKLLSVLEGEGMILGMDYQASEA